MGVTGLFFRLKMPYAIYDKPFKNESDLILFLKEKGLLFHDEAKAKKILRDINYYRFKIYLYPFIDEITKNFSLETYFEDALELYRFDDELRDYLFMIIGRIEIKLRSKLNHYITEYSENPFWYLESKYFQREQQHFFILNKISNTFLNSNEEFIKHYREKYVNQTNDDFKHLPPFWMICEIVTFGEVRNIYLQLNKNEFSTDTINVLDDLSNNFGAYNLRELNQWINYLKIIRNRCAHHSRVWNANYFAPRNIYSARRNFGRLTIEPLNPNRIYSFFAILHIIIKNLELDIDIKNILCDLEIKYPIFDRFKSSAGFPDTWNTDSFWD